MDYHVFDTCFDGVVVTDKTGTVLYSNDAAYLMTQSSPHPLRSGMDFGLLLKFNYTKIKNHAPYSEYTLPTNDGKGLQVQVSIQKETTPEKQIEKQPEKHAERPKDRWIIFMRDLTPENNLHRKYKAKLNEKEKLISTLQETQDQLLQFSKTAALGQFIANITHELNNPLTYVVSAAEELTEVLNHKNHDIEILKTLTGYVYKGAIKILQISDHLKTFLHKPLDKRSFLYTDIRVVIDRAIDFTRHFLVQNQISVVNNIPTDLPWTLMDPTLIEQIAINLIRNSSEAILENTTEANRKIEINGKVEASSNSLIVSFKDLGPGISEATMKNLFKPFFTTKPVGKGTGLGLSICATIAEKHGGTLTVKSTQGQGATFFLTLPILSKDDSEDVNNQENSLSGLKILLVEDDPWIRSLQKTILSRLGCQIEEAENGKEGLEKCQKNIPDIIITDFDMPKMTGVEFAKISKKLYGNTKIILITGSTTMKQIQEHLSLFDDLVVKPFPTQSIPQAIMNVLAKSH